MDDSPHLEDSKLDAVTIIKLDYYRWIILVIFASYCGTNFFQFAQFTIIADITERYYDVSRLCADATGLVFLISYLLFFIPVGHFVENNNLRSTALVSTGLTAIGNFVKLFAAVPGRFYLIIISQILCGTGQVFMISLPPKVASIWFGAKEVSFACAIGVMGCQLGLALGNLVPSLMVPNNFNIQEISEGFYRLFIVDNIASLTVFVLVCFFFRSKPEYPPSLSQATLGKEEGDEKMSYLEAFKGFMKNKDYILILISFGLSLGLLNAIGILINELYVHFFPENERNLGLLILISILAGGVFGTLVFGYILDQTHEFKKVSTVVLILNGIVWTSLMISFTMRSLFASSILIPICGIFIGSSMVIALENIIETTYPTPESYGTSLLYATIYAFGIVYVLVLQLTIHTVGITAGQILIIASFATAAAINWFVSPNFKRLNANSLDSQCTYETRSCTAE